MHYLEDSRCQVIVSSAAYKNRLLEALAACASAAPPALIILEEAGLCAEELRKGDGLPDDAAAGSGGGGADSTAAGGCLLLYTSGTTSKPKGVLHTHASVSAQVASLTQAWHWRPDDVALHCLPLHHIHGIVNILYCALASRACVVFAGKFDAARVVEALASGSITVFMAVPTVYHKLLAAIKATSAAQQLDLKACLKAHVRLMVKTLTRNPKPKTRNSKASVLLMVWTCSAYSCLCLSIRHKHEYSSAHVSLFVFTSICVTRHSNEYMHPMHTFTLKCLHAGVCTQVCGSAALPVSVMKEWAAASGHCLLERYGMSEVYPLTTPVPTAASTADSRMGCWCCIMYAGGHGSDI